MNILAVLLPFLMSLMVGFGAIRVIRMMHQIIHGGSSIATDMMEHLQGTVQNAAGYAARAASAGAAAIPAAATAATAASGAAGAAASGEAGATPPGAATAGDMLGASGLEASDGGGEASSTLIPGAETDVSDHDTNASSSASADTTAPVASSGSSDTEESDSHVEPVPAALFPSGSGDTAGNNEARDSRILRTAGRMVGGYRRGADAARTTHAKVVSKMQAVRKYAKSTAPGFVARALIQGHLTNAPAVMHGMYPEYKAATKQRHAQMRNIAHRAVERKLGPYIPQTGKSAPSMNNVTPSASTGAPATRTDIQSPLPNNAQGGPPQRPAVSVRPNASSSSVAQPDVTPTQDLPSHFDELVPSTSRGSDEDSDSAAIRSNAPSSWDQDEVESSRKSQSDFNEHQPSTGADSDEDWDSDGDYGTF
jgi:hypothetical protein